ncbi:MAG TPA: hypothetical protein VF100_12940 [Thermoanaerobaculia bacterium]
MTRIAISAILILALSLVAGPAAGQEPAVVADSPATAAAETPPAAEAAAAAEPGRSTPSSNETRSEFSRILRQHPPELGTILALDPTLLSNEAFLAGYPELASYVAANPEVRRNPRFYLAEFQERRRQGALDEIAETLVIFAIFALIALALGWFVRTLIEQKRWSRLSRSQSEVHNKILDRFGSSEELLEYVKTPAGRSFLESAPIPLHAERPAANLSAPLSRVLWSIQIGVVVAVAALGMLLVSARFEEETAQGLFALGAIGVALGLGFVAAAAVSLLLSRRLGLWPAPSAPAPAAAEAFGDAGR